MFQAIKSKTGHCSKETLDHWQLNLPERPEGLHRVPLSIPEARGHGKEDTKVQTLRQVRVLMMKTSMKSRPLPHTSRPMTSKMTRSRQGRPISLSSISRDATRRTKWRVQQMEAG